MGKNLGRIALTIGLFCALSFPASAQTAKQNGDEQNFVPLYEQTDKKVTYYKSWDIPEYAKPDPNYVTLRHYLRKQLDDARGFDKHVVSPSSNPYQFKSARKSNAKLDREFQTSSLLSYLFYEDGAIIYDEITSKDMFGDIVKVNTPLRSNSIGKSMTSYVLGHAICAGYIDGVESRIDDWSLVKDTVYDGQRLIDILNMRAGDEKYVHDSKGLLSSGRWYNIHSVKSFAQQELKGTRPSRNEGSRRYHYNGLATNIILNYVIHKTGPNFQSVLNEAFRRNARIESPVYFFINRGHGPKDGASWYMFYATRYDYLRISRAMMLDWQNDTCVGKYLKTIYSRAQSKGEGSHPNPRFSAKKYGGQFHIGYSGISSRKVLGMDGYGGQSILIDMDKSRIVVVNSIHTDYDWRSLVLDVIRNGDLKR